MYKWKGIICIGCAATKSQFCSMKLIFSNLVALFTVFTVFAQPVSSSKAYNLEKGLAIQGYDPVAYFKSNKAIQGKKELAAQYEGVIYYFSSQANKDAFSKNPRAFEPQYGGWCAYAMGATGEKVEIDPETFKILGGKLYLFYHSWSNNTLIKWNKEEVKLKSAADASWKKFTQ
jgi:YHS domain-containing protein